ncbi:MULTISPECIES: sensor histidine kinase [Paenibacillus]|uniref:histidine kinase n=2 Tax=Paenibacillus lactis TaxID=228574 RepID=G4HKW9_9BACL|nr:MULTISPECIES: sensor histidine kinase [Paenibacillus]EHB57423.1 integral membrane sensor signal transduction histidine kinase [Paenibacillus lactis 154]MBP1893883.1 signal transduction histidine kinase [Paenibacillus lactis]MCM3492514.1 sensor histidine kinase [Paenibacillus lactis]
MSFLRYLEDKRYVILLAVAQMLFATLMMFVSASGKYDAGDIFYTLLGCLILTATYLIVGYARRYAHYQALDELTGNDDDDIVAAVPKPISHEQQLYTALARKLHQAKLDTIRKYHGERKDYHDFIMSWIHEVKLPITAAHLLMRNSAGKSAEELVNKLEDEVNKIDHYVEQALYYSRIDSFSRDYLIAEVSLNQIMRACVRKYAKLFVAKRLRFTMWEEEHTVHSDAKWLGFILDQIITNALKYTNQGGAVTCSIEDNPSEKRLLIRDTGIGILPEDLGRIFDKGFTGSTGRNDAKSTGLGLYLASQMAIKLGHRLSARSEPGQYTELAIIFPKSRSIHEMM